MTSNANVHANASHPLPKDGRPEGVSVVTLILAVGAASLNSINSPIAVGQTPTSQSRVLLQAQSGLYRLPSTEHGSLTLADAEQLAIAQNPSLAQSTALVEAARGRWLQAGLWPDPTVSIGEAQMGSQGLAEQDFAAVSQTFVTKGKLRLNRAAAAQGVIRAEQHLLAQRNRVLTDVRIAYFDVLIAHQQRETSRRLVKIAQEGVEVAKKAKEESETGQNDILEAQIELYAAEIALQTTENHVTAAQTNLLAVLGEQQWCFPQLAGRFDAIPPARTWQQTLDRLLCHSPELAAGVAEQEESRWSLERARAGKVPDVTVQGLFNWRDNGTGGDPNGGLQVSLPLPIWDGNRGNIATAESEVLAASRALAARRLDLQRRLAAVFERYSNARQQVEQYRERILNAAQEALALTIKSFEAGEVDYDDVITSQRTNATANVSYLDALRELWIAEFEIEGLLLSDSLTPLAE